MASLFALQVRLRITMPTTPDDDIAIDLELSDRQLGSWTDLKCYLEGLPHFPLYHHIDCIHDIKTADWSGENQSDVLEALDRAWLERKRAIIHVIAVADEGTSSQVEEQVIKVEEGESGRESGDVLRGNFEWEDRAGQAFQSPEDVHDNTERGPAPSVGSQDTVSASPFPQDTSYASRPPTAAFSPNTPWDTLSATSIFTTLPNTPSSTPTEPLFQRPTRTPDKQRVIDDFQRKAAEAARAAVNQQELPSGVREQEKEGRSEGVEISGKPAKTVADRLDDYGREYHAEAGKGERDA